MEIYYRVRWISCRKITETSNQLKGSLSFLNTLPMTRLRLKSLNSSRSLYIILWKDSGWQIIKEIYFHNRSELLGNSLYSLTTTSIQSHLHRVTHITDNSYLNWVTIQIIILLVSKMKTKNWNCKLPRWRIRSITLSGSLKSASMRATACVENSGNLKLSKNLSPSISPLKTVNLGAQRRPP